MKNIDYFDKQKGLINLILYMHDNGKANISGIRNDGKINFGVAYKCLNIMKELGLSEIENEGTRKEKSRHKAKHYHLTEKGQQVATTLIEIDDLGDSNGKLGYLDNQTGLIKLILYLSKYEKGYVSEIQRKGRINTVQECLNLLDHWGFVDTRLEYPKKTNGRTKTNHYYLTENGMNVADKLKTIERLVSKVY